jgi:hypothetical protein
MSDLDLDWLEYTFDSSFIIDGISSFRGDVYLSKSRVIKLFRKRSFTRRESEIMSEQLFFALSSSLPCVLDVEDDALRCELNDFRDPLRFEFFVAPLFSVM